MPIQRRVMMPDAAVPPSWREIRRGALRHRIERQRSRFRLHSDYRLAQRIGADMADAGDEFRFSDNDELVSELTRRAATSRLMQSTQRHGAGDMQAFGYPFSGASLYWGPRVNYAARGYWTPAVVDGYDQRRDSALRRQLERMPRGRRHQITHDPAPGTYSWTLTPVGQADPYEALVRLFVPQPPHRRSLIHCDYLLSLIQFRSLAESIGKAEFNRRVQAYGVTRVELRWDLFKDLQDHFARTGTGGATRSHSGMGVLQSVRPTSPADLVIGDHVIFWNHVAYDELNAAVGNAWRLENAILIDRRDGVDTFLGHGSGVKTRRQMHEKLAGEYNVVAGRALRLIRQLTSRSRVRREQAQVDLAASFPNLQQRGGRWVITGTADGDMPLRFIRYSEVIGLYDPNDRTLMNFVRRPIESR